MKRKAVMTALALALVAGVAWAAAEGMSVQVRQAQVRSQPNFLASVVGTLDYGQRVQTLEDKGQWLKVAGGQGPSGWVHLSSLTKKEVVLNAGQAGAGGASGEELALAGKGFNKDVEADFAAHNQGANFAAVNQMEHSFLVGEPQMQAFLKEGGVTPGTGGAQ